DDVHLFLRYFDREIMSRPSSNRSMASRMIGHSSGSMIIRPPQPARATRMNSPAPSSVMDTVVAPTASMASPGRQTVRLVTLIFLRLGGHLAAHDERQAVVIQHVPDSGRAL